MWKEFFGVIMAFAILVFAVSFLYTQLPGEPVELREIQNTTTANKTNEVVDYGTTPVFAKNLRFNHDSISYFIESGCSEARQQKMKQAFNIFSEEMEVVSFYEVESRDADILVGCSEDYIKESEDMFIAGEGGPSKYLNGSEFNIILEGKIILYRESKCTYPVVELHELLHVFGFNHVDNPKSLMYNTSSCDQKITKDMKDTIKSLYQIKPKPDIEISSIDATKKGKYLDFEISMKNTGLVDSEIVNLTVYSDGEKAKSFEIGKLELLKSRTLTVENMILSSKNLERILFEILQVTSPQDDFDLSDNRVEMVV